MSIADIDGVQYPIEAARFYAFEGESLDMVVTVRDSNKALVDLTDCTFNFALGSLTEATSGVTITGGGTAGTITISITAAAMAAITIGTHDIGLSYSVSTVTRQVFAGTFTAKESYL